MLHYVTVHTAAAAAAGQNILPEQKHVQGACSGQGSGDGVKPHLCVFQSLAISQDIQPDPQGTAGVSVQLFSALCPSTGTAIPLHPTDTAHLTIPSASHYKEGKKSPATAQISAAETCRSTQSQVLLGQRERDF